MLACLLLMCDGWDWRAGLASSEAKPAQNIDRSIHTCIQHTFRDLLQTQEPVTLWSQTQEPVAVGSRSDRSPHIDLIR